MEREDITPSPLGYPVKDDKKLAIAPVTERKERLTAIMRESLAYPSLVKAGHVIGAIDVLNRMEGLYAVPFGFNDNRVINIICDAKTAGLIEKIGERTRPSIPQAIVEKEVETTTSSNS